MATSTTNKLLFDLLRRIEKELTFKNISENLAYLSEELNTEIDTLDDRSKLILIKFIIGTTNQKKLTKDIEDVYTYENSQYLMMKIILGSKYYEWYSECLHRTELNPENLSMIKLYTTAKDYIIDYFSWRLPV